jgi:peptidoglycan/xylan/chitin deacetylase (PgdA/CDA1 family)
MYHRFGNAAAGLRAQCEHIRRHYHPVSMQQVADSFESGAPLPAGAIAVTVDDGYRDFVTTAEPVFRAFDIPTTVFVVSDVVDRKRWLTSDVVAYALRHTRRHVTIDGTAFCERMKGLPLTESEQAIERLLRDLEVELPATPPDEDAAMTWDDARTVSGRGVEVGAHTRTHPILSRVPDADRLRDEILSPKARIESELGMPVLHFCYPNGRREDFTDEAVALVSSAFRTGVTTERGINFSGATPSTLRRLGVGPEIPLPYFAELLAGVRAA